MMLHYSDVWSAQAHFEEQALIIRISAACNAFIHLLVKCMDGQQA